MDNRLRRALFVTCLTLCILPWVSTAMALVAGIVFSLLIGNPWPRHSAIYSKVVLQLSVVGLGFSLSLREVLQTGKSSVIFTIVGITFTLTFGHLLGILFKTDKNTSALISFGTAICGGSAIAAMTPVLKAKNEETAVALATVFTLNSVALLLFPLLGHIMHLEQNFFGTWAGLSIHDTSSVVGATAAYGAEALRTGTTVKLTRAIWIAPVVMVTAWLKKSDHKAGVPLFIIGFILAASLRTLLPEYAPYWEKLAAVARQCLVLTLFLVGAGLSREVLNKVGLRPLLHGITLWIVVSSVTLTALMLVGLN